MNLLGFMPPFYRNALDLQAAMSPRPKRGDGRAFTLGNVFEVQVAHAGGGVRDGAGDAGFLGGGRQVRDGVAGFDWRSSKRHRRVKKPATESLGLAFSRPFKPLKSDPTHLR